MPLGESKLGVELLNFQKQREQKFFLKQNFKVLK